MPPTYGRVRAVPVVGWRRAHRHLERQLDPLPHRPRGGVAAAHRRRRPAIQETKATDAQFPFARLRALGYEVAHHGLNHWNGVAILSRVGLDDVRPASRRPRLG